MAIANNIQAMREERGWSRPELARLAKTSPQQIERLEKAQRRLGAMLDRAKILVVASHDESLIKKICNKVMRLEHGNMVEFSAIPQINVPAALETAV